MRVNPHRLFLYSVRVGNRILENFYLWRRKGEDDEQNCDNAKRGNSKLWAFAYCLSVVKQPCFVDIRYGGRNKENSDIDPVRRFADHTVIGVENYRNQDDSKNNAT